MKNMTYSGLSVVWTPRCERCGSPNITNGAPHADGDKYQVECHACGHIERAGREVPDA